jgi:hypothetical protein
MFPAANAPRLSRDNNPNFLNLNEKRTEREGELKAELANHIRDASPRDHPGAE